MESSMIIYFILSLLIIFIISRQKRFSSQKNIKNQYKFINTSGLNDIKIALHTIFVLKQNIPFLEEWIEYHTYIGVDRIYLYDNSNSIGNNESSNGVNKYGLNYNNLISLSDIEINNELNRILQKYPNVIYLNWEPRDEKNQVIYAQTLNINEHNKKYGKDTDWTIYTDIDEFLVSKKYTTNGLPIKGFLKKLIPMYKKYNKLMIIQKKFEDRFCNIPKNFYEINDIIKNIDTKKWAPKCIVNNNAFVYLPTDKFSIHEIPVNNENKNKIYLDQDLLCFHHYNVNKKSRTWMKDFYKKNTFDIGIDKSIENYGKVILARINKNFFSNNSNEIINNFC